MDTNDAWVVDLREGTRFTGEAFAARRAVSERGDLDGVVDTSEGNVTGAKHCSHAALS
jgi:hypothetical protein